MKPLLVVATAALALFAALPTLARTQNAVPVQKPFRLRFGAFLPNDNSLRSDVGKEWFSVGASYDLQKSLTVAPRILAVYVDHTGKRFNGGRGAVALPPGLNNAERVSATGVGVAGRFYGDPVSVSTQKYVGVGAGLYRVHVETLSAGTETAIRPGAKALAGLQGRAGLFVEANYILLGTVKGANPSGLDLQLGFRF